MKNGLPRLVICFADKVTRAREGRAVIITRFPSCLQRFFRPLRKGMTDDQFRHLWCFVVGLVVSLRAAKLLHLSDVTPAAGHRTRHGAFLALGAWDAPALVERAAAGLLAGMKPRKGEVVHLILDDNRIPKRGRKMDWVSKIWDHKQQRFVRGHIALVAAVAFRGVVLPWRVDLWKPKGTPKGHGGGRYRKLTDMAAAMIGDFAAPAPGVKVRVLFDAFYLCPTVTKACEAKGFTFFSVAARNRNFTRASDGKRSAKRRTVGRLMPGLIRHQGKTVRMSRSRGRRATLRIASVDGHLSRIGNVRMVVSKRPRGPWKKCIAVVTNETGLRPRQIIAIYESRWLIEVLFKELHQDLGLGDYQVLHRDAILRHLHLCCLAHLLLTHRSLQAIGAKATKPDEQVEMPRMNERLAGLRAEVARDQIRGLVRGARHAKLRQVLYDRLLAA
jgi:SRSO17 transposase